jgi:cytochrome c-L
MLSTKSRIRNLRRWLATAGILLGMTTAALAVEFRHALDGSPLNLAPLPGEELTPAVKSFHETGVNPYKGNPEALAKGKELYETYCHVCHLPDGSGKMGPSLISDTPVLPRAGTDVGKFEIIHSGASGAMSSFSRRGLTQDQILSIIAYVHSLKK